MGLQASASNRPRKIEKVEAVKINRTTSAHERQIIAESRDRYSEFMESVNRTSDREIERALKHA